MHFLRGKLFPKAWRRVLPLGSLEFLSQLLQIVLVLCHPDEQMRGHRGRHGGWPAASVAGAGAACKGSNTFHVSKECKPDPQRRLLSIYVPGRDSVWGGWVVGVGWFRVGSGLVCGGFRVGLGFGLI